MTAPNTPQQTPTPTGGTSQDFSVRPTSTPAPAPSPAPAPAPVGAQDTGFRFTAAQGIPDYLVGKTAQEVAQIADQMYQALRQGQRAPAAVAPQTPAPPPPLVGGSRPPTQDEWLTDPAAAYNMAMAHTAATQFTPVMQQQAQIMKQQVIAVAEMRHKDTFSKWGPEVHALLGPLDPLGITPEVVDRAVDMVRGRHASEIADAAVNQRLEQMISTGALLRPGAGGGGPAPAGAEVDFTQLPPAYADYLRRVNVTPKELDEFLRKTEPGVPLAQARAKWFEDAKNNTIVTEYSNKQLAQVGG